MNLRQPRMRYIVKLERNGETTQIVIIARNLKGMYREIYQLYGHFLTDEKGNDAGTISFEEIPLFPTVKEELHTLSSSNRKGLSSK
ncbi:hypothetical protein NLX67_18340 [Domibacillus sp. A3M-37]|uniref:hypothetical protein n=1 Tax=Domibacillus sp. A3M-37 TaxID=2962037 RepID=UPI0020B7C59C|nr:hypothetical protein [Domibacillus sp. A3M-37]MCP3764310.1 hypothetical protein [Domibacillus sp. A3M-37]